MSMADAGSDDGESCASMRLSSSTESDSEGQCTGKGMHFAGQKQPAQLPISPAKLSITAVQQAKYTPLARRVHRIASMRRQLLPVLGLLFSVAFVLCVAPKGKAAGHAQFLAQCTLAAAPAAAGAAASSGGSSVGAGLAAVGAVSLTMSAAAAWAMRGKHTDGAKSKPKAKVAKGSFAWRAASACDGAPVAAARSGSDVGNEPVCAPCGDSMWDELSLCSDAESESEDALDEQGEADSAPEASCSSNGKLWGRTEFPEGLKAASNYELANILAAQAWTCPCPDRVNCLGRDRVSLFELYEHRKNFQTKTAPANGGLRDALRKELDQHLDRQTGKHARSFKVGGVVDCCAASAGLASGAAFATWSRSRADSRKDRPLRKGRVQVQRTALSAQRAHLRAYIRQLRGGFEGPKGGSDPNDKWRTAYMPMEKRYQIYCKERTRLGLSVGGSLSAFKKAWSEFDDIVQEKSSGHAKCRACGELESRFDALDGRMDKEGKKLQAQLQEEKQLHERDHLGEREYAEDWCCTPLHCTPLSTPLQSTALDSTRLDSTPPNSTPCSCAAGGQKPSLIPPCTRRLAWTPRRRSNSMYLCNKGPRATL